MFFLILAFALPFLAFGVSAKWLDISTEYKNPERVVIGLVVALI